MIKTPTLFILVGNPFSGKTTLGKSLQKKLSCHRMAFDEVWVDLESDPSFKLNLSFESVTEYIKKEISKNLNEGISVIYDSLNDTPDQRDMWEELANSLGADFRILFLDIPIEEIALRREKNEKTRKRHTVSDKKFASALDKFVAPKGPRVVVYRLEDKFEEWFSKNFE